MGDWCDSAFGTAFGTFPSEADGPQPMVAFSDRLFSDEVLADSAGSVHRELPMLALRIFSDVGVTVIPLLSIGLLYGLWTGWSVRANGWMRSRYLPGPICDPPIHIGDGDVDLSHGDTERVRLSYPAGVRSVNNGTVVIA